jgi:hypothetical protein
MPALRQDGHYIMQFSILHDLPFAVLATNQHTPNPLDCNRKLARTGVIARHARRSAGREGVQ